MADAEHILKLEDKIAKLKDELADQQNNLYKAAEFGKKLLEDNGELENKIQVLAKDQKTEIESLEQQKYSLQLKLEQKCHMESVYVDEIEGLKGALQKQMETMSLKAEAEYQSEVSKLKNQVSQQQTELDGGALGERQLRERNAELERLLDETREQLQQRVSSMNETCSEEMAQLHADLNSLNNDKVQLLLEVGDVKDQVQQLLLQVNSQREQLHRQDTELEERQCQITSYFNALEKSREENLELKAEIDLLKMESQDQKGKGNSLFSEVEDRRVQAEKELISLKVEYASLRKQYEASRQNHYKLRMQVAGLLQVSGGRAQADQVDSLQQQLSEKNEQLLTLINKLQKYEKNEKNATEQMVEFQEAKGGTVNTNYLEFLQALNDNKQREFDKLQEELRTKSLQLLAESQKLVGCQSKLFSHERVVDTLRAQNYKLTVQVEELQLKYEPDKCKTSKKVRKVLKEEIPLSEAERELIQKENQKKLIHSVKDSVLHDSNKPLDGERKPTDIQIKKEKLKEELVKMSASNNGENETAKVSLLKQRVANLCNDPLNDKVVDSKKRKVTISDENEIVESQVLNDTSCTDVNNSDTVFPDEKLQNRQHTEQQRKSKIVQKPIVKVSKAKENPDECKNQ